MKAISVIYMNRILISMEKISTSTLKKIIYQREREVGLTNLRN